MSAPETKHVKIHIADPTGGERVWAIIVDEDQDLYCIDNMPLSSLCNYGDIVYAPGYEFEGIREKGSYQTTVTVDPEVFDTNRETLGAEMKRRGLRAERYLRQFIAFSTPKSSDGGSPDLGALRSFLLDWPGVIDVEPWE